MEELLYEKYLAEIEEHGGIIVQISKDYGKETHGVMLKNTGDNQLSNIARGDAEKAMLLGAIRFILDHYIDGGK